MEVPWDFRSFLFAVLLPPVFLFVQKRVFAGVFSLVFWRIAWILLVSVLGALFSPIPCLISFLPAAFALRRLEVDEAAEVMARKIAAAMQGPQKA